ncbi:MAG: phosphogluconate dehydrogenase (NAD(+)-dependent, decarboxylating) [Aggregatilineales bacterium]
MELGMIGLGKMGANMTRRLMKGGHRVVVFDANPQAIKELTAEGAIGSESDGDLVSKLKAPRAVWIMLPAGEVTGKMVDTLTELLSPGDTILDGGNSYYKDTVKRAEAVSKKGLFYVDVGTSGGVWGLTEGYSMMIGGDKTAVERLSPIFVTLAPAADKGWGYVGPSGAGHFVKMVHNGIEYGLMESFAEGFALLRQKKDFNLDLVEVAHIWQDGSVIRAWLLDLIHDALESDRELKDVAPYVEDSGEGRWTTFEAIDLNVSTPVIIMALERRIRSREDDYTDKLLAMMRHGFGGHTVKRES